MSLRAVHVVFILASIATAFGFAFWCWTRFRSIGGGDVLAMGVSSLLVGAALAAYLPIFLKKTAGGRP